MQKILLSLNGKRIEGTKLVEDQDGSFDWVKVSYADTDTHSYVLIDYDAAVYEAAKGAYNYFDAKAKKIKPMTVTKATVDKTTIENDGIDTAIYTITVGEPMTVYVQQQIGESRENGIFSLIPDSGKITLRINSDCIGTIRLSALGDTKYTESIEIQVV